MHEIFINPKILMKRLTTLLKKSIILFLLLTLPYLGISQNQDIPLRYNIYNDDIEFKTKKAIKKMLDMDITNYSLLEKFNS